MARFGEQLAGLTAFVRAVDLGSFSRAARALGTSPSAVSKAVAQLEDRTGVLLLRRSTRRLALTSEGFALYERGTRIVRELEAAESELKEARGPRGTLRIAAPLDLGRHWLVPLIPRFNQRYPQVRCVLDLSDRVVDLAREGFDVAIRMGEHATPSTIRRRLGPTTSMLCASTAYLRKHGTPKKPSDLVKHDCLLYVRHGRQTAWRIGDEEIAVHGSFAANNHDALLAMALAHRGIVRLPSFVAQPLIATRALRPLLTTHAIPGLTAYVAYPERRHIAPRVTAFADFVTSAFQMASSTPQVLSKP